MQEACCMHIESIWNLPFVIEKLISCQRWFFKLNNEFQKGLHLHTGAHMQSTIVSQQKSISSSFSMIIYNVMKRCIIIYSVFY